MNNNNQSSRKPFTCPLPNEIDYKDINLLRRFLSSFGKIVPRTRSGISAKQQRAIANAIKRARVMALLPFEIK